MGELIFKRTLPRHPNTREYDFVVEGKIVGFLQLRQIASAGEGVPEHMASHVYYEVVPEERGKGYASNILNQCVGEARKLGMIELCITSDKSNSASCKVIEKNAGVLIDSAVLPEEELLKYRIQL